MHAPTKKAPRAAATYRGAVRNTWKAARRLPEWREKTAAMANQAANLAGRAAVANGAREAAAAAMVNNRAGIPSVTAAAAMLGFYLGEKRTRPVNRIIRELERSVGGARQ